MLRRRQRKRRQRRPDLVFRPTRDRIGRDPSRSRRRHRHAAGCRVSHRRGRRDIPHHDLRDRFRPIRLVVLADRNVGAERHGRIFVHRARSRHRRHIRHRTHHNRNLNRILSPQQSHLPTREYALDGAHAHIDVEVQIAVRRRLHLQARRQERLELESRRRRTRRKRIDIAHCRNRDPVRKRRRIDQRHAGGNRDLRKVVLLRPVRINAAHRDRQCYRLVLVAQSRTRDRRAIRNRGNGNDHRRRLRIRHPAQIFGRRRDRQRDVLIRVLWRRERQRRQFGADVRFRPCQCNRPIRRHRLRHVRSATRGRISHDRTRRKSRHDDLRKRLRQRVVDEDADVIAEHNGRIFIRCLRRCSECDRVCHRVHQNADRRACNLLVAVRTFRRDRNNRHSIEQATLVRRRQEIHIRNLRWRQRVGLGAITGHCEGILCATTVRDFGICVDAPNLDNVRLRSVDEIAEGRGEIIKMHERIFVGRLVIPRCRHRIGDRFHIDVIVEVNCFTVLVTWQRRIHIALDCGYIDTKRDAAVKILWRRHGQRQQQRLDFAGRARHQKGAIRLLNDRTWQTRVPTKRRPGWQICDHDLLEIFRSIRIIERD